MTDQSQSAGPSLKTQLAEDDSPVGSWVSLSSAAAAEAVGGLGFDFLTIDAEHTAHSFESIEHLVRAVDAAGDSDALVRVAENDPVPIKRVLDMGVAGVMAPQINTEAEAEALVEATRYPPEGVRGVAGSRDNEYGRALGTTFERANDEVVAIAQIESERAVANAEAIAGVDGVDALFLGPADLSSDMDCFGAYDDPGFVDAVERIVDAADAAGCPVGTLAVADEEIEMWHDRGFDFQIVGTDVGYLTNGAQSAKERYESLR